jgi:hypothetical protein
VYLVRIVRSEKLAAREGLLAGFARSSLATLGIAVASLLRPASLREAVELA